MYDLAGENELDLEALRTSFTCRKCDGLAEW